ncbi:MAG: lamin tail domain-containing protein [Myxococcota bacterium]|nr:lamin tail domain-containing protein [Myxococcota bacterium]
MTDSLTPARFGLLLPAALLLSACGSTVGPSPDGPDLTIYDRVPEGSMIITEVQAHPAATRPQWLEVFVTGESSIDLKGCQLVDGGSMENRHSITEETIVEPGEHFLVSEADALGAPEGPDFPAQLQAIVIWPEMNLSPTDEAESISLNCPDGTGARHTIDAFSFDWESLDVPRGHSLQYAGEMDSTSNDSPDSWCIAPYDAAAVFHIQDGIPDYGSPLADSYCSDLDGQPTSIPGQVIFTELLVDELAGLREWVELHNPGTVDRDLSGCILGDASAESPENESTHLIEGANGQTVVEAGGYLLLAKSGVDVTSDSTTIAQYAYSALTFNNSGEQLLWLDCPDSTDTETPAVRVDEIHYNWGDFGSEFEGRSLSLDPASHSANGNDSALAWCLASDQEAYWAPNPEDDEDGKPPAAEPLAWGSPGEANTDCPVPDPQPGPGDVVFTEIMVRSAGSTIGHNEEWIELLNVTTQSLSLAGCVLSNGDGENLSEHVIDPVFGLSVSAGEYIVLARASAEDSLACGLPSAYSYGNNISFNNSELESLSLLCGPELERLVVDSVTFDGGAEDFLPGLPRQARDGLEDASSNDDPANWCVDGDPAAFPWSCTVGEDTNYGSPGSTSTCL